MTKEKAAGAAPTATDGMIPERTDVMSKKVARKQRARNSRSGSVAADDRLDVADAPERAIPRDAALAEWVDPVDFFDGEQLATMPLSVRNVWRNRVKVWRGSDGAWYRHAGFLRIQEENDGVRKFVVLLSRGANRSDLDSLLAAVKRNRAGESGRVWVKRDVGWGGWADDRTFTYALTSRLYVDPYTHYDVDPEVVACEEASCCKQWHEDDDNHELDRVSADRPGGRYSISVNRSSADPEAPWFVNVYADDFEGTPEMVAAFVSDLQWMQEACRRANAARAEKVAS